MPVLDTCHDLATKLWWYTLRIKQARNGCSVGVESYIPALGSVSCANGALALVSCKLWPYCIGSLFNQLDVWLTQLWWRPFSVYRCIEGKKAFSRFLLVVCQRYRNMQLAFLVVYKVKLIDAYEINWYFYWGLWDKFIQIYCWLWGPTQVCLKSVSPATSDRVD